MLTLKWSELKSNLLAKLVVINGGNLLLVSQTKWHLVKEKRDVNKLVILASGSDPTDGCVEGVRVSAVTIMEAYH